MSALGGVRDYFSARSRAMGAGVLVLVALAVGRLVTDQLPDPRAIGNAPFERVVQIGQPAHLRVGDVTVTKVQGGKAWASVSEAKLSPGLWLVADLTFVPTQPDAAISHVTVREPSGGTWERGRGTTTCSGGVPGVPMTCHVTVEIPERALPGAELVLRWKAGDLRWDDQAVVPLTIDKATLAQWAAVTEPIKVPNSTVGTP